MVKLPKPVIRKLWNEETEQSDEVEIITIDYLV